MKTPDAILTVYIDMDDVLCDYETAYSLCKRKRPELTYPQSEIGFFRNLLPVHDAVAAFNRLDRDPGFSVFILTAPSVKNVHCYTEKRQWVEDHLGCEAAYKLIICPNKGLLKGGNCQRSCTV